MTTEERADLWDRYQKYLVNYEEIGLTLDISRMQFYDGWIEGKREMCEAAIAEMIRIEAGEIINTDENRQVGHYWLRDSTRAPEEYRQLIDDDVANADEFARAVRNGQIRGETGEMFKHFLLIGIGGSALGPQFVTEAIGCQSARENTWFFDNTDPDGIDSVLAEIGKERLRRTLTVVASKSGGTAETRNGMLEAKRAYEACGLKFEKHAVAITGDGSALHQFSTKWLNQFPMYDWIGGRTSVMSMVGLLPAALQGIKIGDFLAGAKAMDELTRQPDTSRNAAMLLALMWFSAGNGKGDKDMVILPYKDRLSLFSNYLQQLVMESLGKELDRDGKVVNQGIVVYGNKGSTDQHAYVQQLRDGTNNFFATFIEVRQARDEASAVVDAELDATTGDFLQGFLRGTRKALTESGRESITISLEKVDAFRLGALIALFERAVTFYAAFINVNAYHQPGVEAGKAAAGEFLRLMHSVRDYLKNETEGRTSAEEIAGVLAADAEDVHHILTHLAANPR